MFGAHPLLLMAITTSSNEAFPARSPMPLMVHSIWRAPAMAPARLLAVESPRSFWQCVEKTAFSAPGVFARRSAIKPPNSCGRFHPAKHQPQHQAGAQIILTVHGRGDSPLCLMYLGPAIKPPKLKRHTPACTASASSSDSAAVMHCTVQPLLTLQSRSVSFHCCRK